MNVRDSLSLEFASTLYVKNVESVTLLSVAYDIIA
jgi:hypothetical protein